MKILKSKGFFIKSFFLLVFLLLATTWIAYSFFEPFAYNFMIKDYTSRNKVASENTVIIAIDDRSISYHRWPWPREYYGKIINYLTEYSNPKVIGFDAIIPSLDKDNPESDKKFFQSVKNSKKLVVGFDAVTDYIEDLDRTKAYNKKFKEKLQTTKITPIYSVYLPNKYVGILESPPPYFDAIKYSASVKTTKNYRTDYLYNVDEIISVDGAYYPYLALQMYLVANNADEIQIYPNKLYIPKTKTEIPVGVSRNGLQTQLRFYKLKDEDGYTHTKYSASDIIRSYDAIKKGQKPIIDPKEFDGKVVFIGACAKAKSLSLEDALPTPIHTKQPGTDIVATNYDNIANEDFITFPTPLQVILIIFAITILAFIIINKLPFVPAIILLTGLYILYYLFAMTCYYAEFALPVTPPLAVLIVTSVFGYSYRFILEGRNKEKIKNAMGKYLSQDVMQNVVQNIDDVKLGGKRAVVTVLFSDIRGFTSMSEKMSAEEVSNILNEYFSEMEPIITKYNGVINKFIGDAVMAIFGEPIQDLNHPVNAVKCAYAMLKKVKELQEKWLLEGKPKIEIGVGINTGEAFVGNIGSEKRLEYTVIGDTVNLASRIEGYNKIYHTNLLVSSSTYNYISDIADVIKISDVQIRGKAKKMDIYEVLRLNDNNK
ncbi:adenylate/guanylate cyclase domain-containing protein [bacterium]|nr:adenylate/guanylate cyclase domain-containing protein [bacterium]